jgi:hypothetical protein
VRKESPSGLARSEYSQGRYGFEYRVRVSIMPTPYNAKHKLLDVGGKQIFEIQWKMVWLRSTASGGEGCFPSHAMKFPDGLSSNECQGLELDEVDEVACEIAPALSFIEPEELMDLFGVSDVGA